MAVRRWLFDLPTRVHLWCAEHELRAAPADGPARSHNLDLLRDYRRGREFPRHSRSRPAPRFVDAGGRHCAVAHLMDRTGAGEAVERIRGADNFARLRDMDPAPLRDWQHRSGLSVAELARIQPTYPPQAEVLILGLAFLQLLLSPFALGSIAVNLLRLTRSRLRAVARTAGLVLGSLLLLCVAVIAGIDLAASEYDPCHRNGSEPPPPGSNCGDSVSAPWLIVGLLGTIGVLSLAAVWFNRHRGAVLDELLAD